MAGFRKAKAEQAALKVSMYGPPGSGKTFTALLLAEGLARASGKRVAYIDTERGTDFYSLAVPARDPHPEAFDFDALYTRSLTEALEALRGLKPDEHGVVVVDSITHLWEAAKLAYRGRTHGGKIPFHAWDGIKKPYKALMQLLVNSPMHVLILGRQGNEFAEDEETGETKAAGVKMKAEGETQYEPHVCIRMEAVKGASKTRPGVITAFVEKDRTGILNGRLIQSPTYAKLAEPMLALLGGTQAQLAGEEESSQRDAEAIASEAREKAAASRILRDRLSAELGAARTPKDVAAVAEGIKPVKGQLLPVDLEAVHSAYRAARDAAAVRATTPPAEADPAEEAERAAIRESGGG